MKIPKQKSKNKTSGYALLMVLTLTAVSVVVASATLSRAFTSAKINERNNVYQGCNFAAEASTEAVLARMMMDYQIDADAKINQKLDAYRHTLPSGNANAAWDNYEFSDGQGNVGINYIARKTTSSNPPYVALQSQYSGLYGFAATYRVVSNARSKDSSFADVVGAAQQEIQLAEIPVFQFAIFYDGLMEYTYCAPLTVRGRVHANADIYTGSSANVQFTYPVTTTGIITNKAWDGHSTRDYTGTTTYSGSPYPGYGTGEPALTLPLGAASTPDTVREIINIPPDDEDTETGIGEQRYYNKAGLVIIVKNNTVQTTIKNSATDPYPISVDWTNISNVFISTNLTFYDQREGRTIRTTQIDIGRFKDWIGTNSDVATKFDASTGDPLNIVYIADLRTTNSSYLTGVRLVNGQTLPSGGLTLATLNPLYVWGHLNCPSHPGSTNTTDTVPASLISDALTILSSAWVDSKSTSSLSYRNNAASTTVNAAIMTGSVYSTGSGASQFSGGVMNLPRLLEDWTDGHAVLTLNTSMVNMFNSVMATRQFQNPGVYYYAPSSRNFNFDQNFMDSTKLPPGTPRIRRLVKATYCNPQPGTVAYDAPQ